MKKFGIGKILSLFLFFCVGLLFLNGCANKNKTETQKQTGTTAGQSQTAVKTAESTVPAVFDSVLQKSKEVSEDYFKDCVFVGDSLTEGMTVYGVMNNAEVLSHSGLNVLTANEKSYNLLNGKMTMAGAVGQLKKKYVYIMLGSNDVGWMPEKQFAENYDKFVKAIKQASPQSTVILQSIMPVAENYNEKNPKITNEKIDHYNDLIKNIASSNRAYYLNVAEALKNNRNALFENIAEDGMHIKKAGYMKWIEYIRTHTVGKQD